MSSLVNSTLSFKRKSADLIARIAIHAAVAVTLLVLATVLIFTISKGIGAISWGFFTHSMNGVGPLDTNGGIYHAILGTLEQVAIAYVIAVPLGLTVGVYIVEVGRGKLRSALRFLVDVMTGIPSIVAGLFIFSFWVLGLGMGFSGFAGGLALAILMLPTIIRTTEEMLKLVPNELREASYALGVSRWRTSISVVIPAAASGITTGVVLAVARVTGETAPLLLTAFGFDSIRESPFSEPQSALPLYVFSQAGSAYGAAIERAWGAALVIIFVVLGLTILARSLSRKNQFNG